MRHYIMAPNPRKGKKERENALAPADIFGSVIGSLLLPFWAWRRARGGGGGALWFMASPFLVIISPQRLLEKGGTKNGTKKSHTSSFAPSLVPSMKMGHIPMQMPHLLKMDRGIDGVSVRRAAKLVPIHRRHVLFSFLGGRGEGEKGDEAS